MLPVKLRAKPVSEYNKTFLILPSYGEKFNKDVQTITADEKRKLCKQRTMVWKIYLTKFSSKLHFSTVKYQKTDLIGQRNKYIKVISKYCFALLFSFESLHNWGVNTGNWKKILCQSLKLKRERKKELQGIQLMNV